MQILAHRLLLHLIRHTSLVTDVDWDHSSICSQFQYSAQTCQKPTHAQVSILRKHFQLLLKYDADPSSTTHTASSDSTHKLCDRCGLEQSGDNSFAEHQCKHMLVTLAAYGGC